MGKFTESLIDKVLHAARGLKHFEDGLRAKKQEQKNILKGLKKEDKIPQKIQPKKIPKRLSIRKVKEK